MTRRRQFLVTDRPCAAPAGWRETALAGGTTAYTHPDLGVHVARGAAGEVALLGFAVDASAPRRTDADIAVQLAGLDAPAALAAAVGRLGGRFVVLARTWAGRAYVLADPCGLRTVFHATEPGRCALASQAGLLARAAPVAPSAAGHAFAASGYARRDPEAWAPVNAPLWDGAARLVPNHVLDVSSGRQVRVWPAAPLGRASVAEAAAEGAVILRALVEAMAARAPLALPLTAGLDSRVLLAAARPHVGALFAYTLLYRGLTSASPDAAVPAAVLRHLGVPHHLIDCHADPEDHFASTYRAGVDHPHEDWCRIAGGLARAYPDDHVCLKGNCAEIARRYYYPAVQPGPVTVDTLLRAEPGWRGLAFVPAALEAWLAGAASASAVSGVDLLDLFYWEHRMGSWQAQSQLEWDAVQEAFTPFNHRPLLEALLRAPPRSRAAPRYALHRQLVRALWPDLLRWPINPRRGRSRLTGGLRDALLLAGAYFPARRLVHRLRG